MNIIKKIFGKKEPIPAADNIPYYWGTEALTEINSILAKQVEDLEAFTKSL